MSGNYNRSLLSPTVEAEPRVCSALSRIFPIYTDGGFGPTSLVQPPSTGSTRVKLRHAPMIAFVVTPPPPLLLGRVFIYCRALQLPQFYCTKRALKSSPF